MPLPPWVIDELQQERARRDEEDRVRSQRIELPQIPVESEGRADEQQPVAPSVVVVHISPALDGAIDL